MADMSFEEFKQEIADNIKDHLPEEYQGANYHLYFKAEVVQCSDESNTLNSAEVNRAAINEVFGKSLGEKALTFNIVDEKKIYTVAWPGDMSWEAFEGR